MLQLSQSLLNKPVLSLRTGGQVATAVGLLINPNNLKIEGWYCQDRFEKKTLILQADALRDVIREGLVVNDHDALTEPEDLVRLKPIMELSFTLLGKPVLTVSKDKIGKVSDFATEVNTMYVQKLYVAQSLLKNFGTSSLSVDRTQIIEITNRKIVIQDLLQGVKTPTPATVPVA